MTRARITWLDETTTLIEAGEANVLVNDEGTISVHKGDRIRYIPATSYKFIDVES